MVYGYYSQRLYRMIITKSLMHKLSIESQTMLYYTSYKELLG